MPLLSILVPTYNRADLLRPCLDSLLATTVDCEILLSDNASTDDTEAVARSYTDPRLRYHRQPENVGIVANHNFLLAEMRGTYFCLFGDDDVAHPGCFEDKVALLEAHPDLDMVYSRSDIIDEQGRYLPAAGVLGRLPFPCVGGRDEFMTLLINCYIGWQTLVMRRAVYEEVGPLDPNQWGLKASMDWYWLQKVVRGRRAAYIDAGTVAYRIHSGGFSREAERGGHFHADRLAIWRMWLLDEADPPVVDELAWRRMTFVLKQEIQEMERAGAPGHETAFATFEAMRRAYEVRMAARFAAALGG